MCPPLTSFRPTVVHGRRDQSDLFFVESRYSNLEIVGGGSYGVVCSAFDNSSNRKVAIKKVKKVMDDEGDARRILRELRILRHLGGKENTLRILDAYSYPPDTPHFEDVYIVTDLLETDFDRVLRSNQPLADEHTTYFLYQLLRSTANMHRSHILHRDLKPSNLLVNANCDLKVCDFGLSRGVKNLVQPSSTDANSTNNGQEECEHLTEYVVTRWYRAPEILAESPFYGASADMWSVGCIFAEMLAIDRKPIFRGTSPPHQMNLIIKALGIPSEKELNFCTSKASHKAIIQLCERIKRENFKAWDFRERFPSASPMAIDLLQKMLQFNPQDRITAEEALRHPFLANLHKYWPSQLRTRRFDFSFEAVHTLDSKRRWRIAKPHLQQLFLHEVSKYRRVWCPITKPLHHKQKTSSSRKSKKKAQLEEGGVKIMDAEVAVVGPLPSPSSTDTCRPAWTCRNCFVVCYKPLQSVCNMCGVNISNQHEATNNSDFSSLPAIDGNGKDIHLQGSSHKDNLRDSKQGKVKSRLLAQITVAGSRDSSLPLIKRCNEQSRDGANNVDSMCLLTANRYLGKVQPLMSPTLEQNKRLPVTQLPNQAGEAKPLSPLQHRSRSAPLKRRTSLRTLPRHPPFDVPASYGLLSYTPAAIGHFHPLSAR